MTSILPPRPHLADEPRPVLWRITPGAGVLAALVIGGIAFDLGARYPAGVTSVAAVAIIVVAGAVGGWGRDRPAIVLLGLSLLPAGFLAVRDSPWLVPLNIAASAGLLVLAAASRVEPHSLGRALGRLANPITALEPVVMSTELLTDSIRAVLTERSSLGPRLVRIATGVAIGAPIVISLAALLAAADALFRSWVTAPVDPTSIVGHVVLIALGATATAGWAGHGAWAAYRPPARPRELLGNTEAIVILGAVVGIYLAFVIAQVVAIAGGADYVEQTTGLTYKDYARAGFFQLVAAAVLTLVVLVLFARYRRRSTGRAACIIGVLEQATVGLTLVVVGVAIRRLFLYEAAFGLTMLRLYTIVFAGFIGLVFVVVGLTLAGLTRHSPVAAVATIALSTLMAMNIINPERVVAERNISRFGGTPALDTSYLTESLGADAFPTLLDDAATAAVLCAQQPEIDDRAVAFNLGRHRAATALATRCD